MKVKFAKNVYGSRRQLHVQEGFNSMRRGFLLVHLLFRAPIHGCEFVHGAGVGHILITLSHFGVNPHFLSIALCWPLCWGGWGGGAVCPRGAAGAPHCPAPASLAPGTTHRACLIRGPHRRPSSSPVRLPGSPGPRGCPPALTPPPSLPLTHRGARCAALEFLPPGVFMEQRPSRGWKLARSLLGSG